MPIWEYVKNRFEIAETMSEMIENALNTMKRKRSGKLVVANESHLLSTSFPFPHLPGKNIQF